MKTSSLLEDWTHNPRWLVWCEFHSHLALSLHTSNELDKPSQQLCYAMMRATAVGKHTAEKKSVGKVNEADTRQGRVGCTVGSMK